MSNKQLGKIPTLLFISVPALIANSCNAEHQVDDLNHKGKTDQQINATIDQYLQEQMQKRHIPGMALAVVQNGELIYAKGYGLADVENNVPITTESVFLLASITKQFTASAIMMLIEEKKFLSMILYINSFLRHPATGKILPFDTC
jgi:CubicO group peptidase (beta-lactamase class C family)